MSDEELTPPWKDRPWNWSNRWTLPEPDCELGYTEEQVKSIVKDYDDFQDWFYGQTGGVCEEHGNVIYEHDLERYIQ